MLRSVDTLERHAAVLDLRLDVRVSGRSGGMIRLADDEHAAIVEWLARWSDGAGWVVEVEASFSEWGERGRIDLLAYDPSSRLLVIVEVKTLLLDLQDLLGAMNVRERLASTIAGRRGWEIRRTVSILAVADGALNRSVVRRHPALFKTLEVRRLSRTALAAGRRLLIWVPPASAGRSSWVATKQRVRRRRAQV